MRYFITFACYGSHLHGDESGSVDRKHNVFGGRLAEANAGRAAAMREEMDQPPYFLDQARRAAVLDALRQVCLHHGWSLCAAHVRTNHVHVIVEADVRPEKVMHALMVTERRGRSELSYAYRSFTITARYGVVVRYETICYSNFFPFR